MSAKSSVNEDCPNNSTNTTNSKNIFSLIIKRIILILTNVVFVFLVSLLGISSFKGEFKKSFHSINENERYILIKSLQIDKNYTISTDNKTSNNESLIFSGMSCGRKFYVNYSSQKPTTENNQLRCSDLEVIYTTIKFGSFVINSINNSKGSIDVLLISSVPFTLYTNTVEHPYWLFFTILGFIICMTMIGALVNVFVGVILKLPFFVHK